MSHTSPCTQTHAHGENAAPHKCCSPRPHVHVSNYSTLSGALEAPLLLHKSQASPRSPTRARSAGGQGVLTKVQPPYFRKRIPKPTPQPGAYYSTFVVAPPQPKQPDAPSNHHRLPQPEAQALRTLSSQIQPPIYFQLLHFEEAGIRLADTLGANPPIRGANDKVWAGYVERQIEIHIIWPGYSNYPFQKRLKLGSQRGLQTRNELLTIISSIIAEFFDSMKRRKVPVERRYEAYAIGQLPDGSKGLEAYQCFLTALVHCGGTSWQPEIFIPRYPHLAV